jgi:hypothetical protein
MQQLATYAECLDLVCSFNRRIEACTKRAKATEERRREEKAVCEVKT